MAILEQYANQQVKQVEALMQAASAGMVRGLDKNLLHLATIGGDAAHALRQLQQLDYSIAFRSLLQSSTAVDALTKELAGLPSTYSFRVETAPSSFYPSTSMAEPRVKEIVVSQHEGDTEAVPLSLIPSPAASTELFDSVGLSDALSFFALLSRFPHLGLQHEVGMRIFRAVRSDKRSIWTSSGDLVLYHARRMARGRDAPYTWDEMSAAPLGRAPQGRFHPAGRSVWYFSNSLDGAAAEVRARAGTRVQVVEVGLMEGVDLLDLSSRQGPIFEHCYFGTAERSTAEPAYYLPNFVAECCGFHGVAGVRYRSTRADGTLCYAFFNYLEKWFALRQMHVVKRSQDLVPGGTAGRHRESSGLSGGDG